MAASTSTSASTTSTSTPPEEANRTNEGVNNEQANVVASEEAQASPLSMFDGNGNGHENGNGNNNTIIQEKEENEDQSKLTRKGTLTSAKLNILSTMVGGGTLSLPLAFHQAGNSLLAPLLLICIAYLVNKSIHFLIQSAILSHPNDNLKEKEKYKGSKSFESVACAAFGPQAKYFTMGLLSTICFFTIVGYAVLLRDMLLPLSGCIFGSEESTGPSFHHNITMLTVILIVTPLCTLRDLTPLEKVGALSMLSIFTVACCITYRSVQCNFSTEYDDIRLMPWYEYINFWPSGDSGSESTSGGGTGSSAAAFHDLLNALPIFLSDQFRRFNSTTISDIASTLCLPLARLCLIVAAIRSFRPSRSCLI